MDFLGRPRIGEILMGDRVVYKHSGLFKNVCNAEIRQTILAVGTRTCFCVNRTTNTTTREYILTIGSTY